MLFRKTPNFMCYISTALLIAGCFMLSWPPSCMPDDEPCHYDWRRNRIGDNNDSRSAPHYTIIIALKPLLSNPYKQTKPETNHKKQVSKTSQKVQQNSQHGHLHPKIMALFIF